MKPHVLLALACLASAALGSFAVYHFTKPPEVPASAPAATPVAPPTTPPAIPAPEPDAPRVVVNGVSLGDAQLAQLQAKYRVPITPGQYWYDPRNGLWGNTGGPAQGLIMPGEPIGGPLPTNASGGGTGVFINGRELHPQDVQNLDMLFAAFGTRTQPGRYWSDGSGNFGVEGNPAPLGNFRAMMAQASRAGASSYYKNNPWSYTTDYQGFGSNGEMSYYESKKSYGPDKGYTGVYIDESGISYDTPPRSD
jgi:hypothetical protein